MALLNLESLGAPGQTKFLKHPSFTLVIREEPDFVLKAPKVRMKIITVVLEKPVLTPRKTAFWGTMER